MNWSEQLHLYYNLIIIFIGLITSKIINPAEFFAYAQTCIEDIGADYSARDLPDRTGAKN
jgi:hypothetical protein